MSELKKVLGWLDGEFTTDRGDKLKYYRLFVSFPRDNVTGLACEIVKLQDIEVLKKTGVVVGDFVEIYYNENKKAVMVNPVEPTDDDLICFGLKSPVEE